MKFKMKQKLTIITMGLFSLFGCGQKSNLTQPETDLLTKVKFKTELISELKDLTNSELKQLPAIDDETGEVLNDKFFDGVCTETTEEKAVEYVKKLKPKFRENGYLIFVYEGEDHKKNVAVIKGTDDLDILRYRRTDGINHDLENEDVVKKISEWKTKYGLIVIGCSRDWLQVEFDKLPGNIDDFAKEVYEFCPDSVDQGVGTMDKLKLAITEMKGIWLWWD
jgi:predicted small lipoprotein YifL